MYSISQLQALKVRFEHGEPLENLFPFKPISYAAGIEKAVRVADVPLGHLSVSIRRVPDEAIELWFRQREGAKMKQVHIPGLNSEDCLKHVGDPELFDTLMETARHPENLRQSTQPTRIM
jgi:hypothetical protein